VSPAWLEFGSGGEEVPTNIPDERVRGDRLHHNDIDVIERIRSGGAFERTVKQMILKDS
jgi:hypothetical protein